MILASGALPRQRRRSRRPFVEDEPKIGFWDALICASALKAGAQRILSEDLNAGQKIAGIRIENLFLDL
jgi:predicted nucleic acid-binding protein